MYKLLRSAMLVVLLAGLVGCTSIGERLRSQPVLRMDVAFRSMGKDEIEIILWVNNATKGAFAGDEHFNGEMTIYDAVGALRARAKILPLGRIPATSSVICMAWQGRFDPGAYQLTWGSERYGYVLIDLRLAESGGRLEVIEMQKRIVSSLPPTPASSAPTHRAPTPPIDAEAQALVELARADLARRLSIDMGRVTVQAVTPTEFRDSSLGVPEPGKAYLQVITPGYIIILDAQGTLYRYHGAGQRVVAATGERSTQVQPPTPRVPTPTESPLARPGPRLDLSPLLPEGVQILSQVDADLRGDGMPVIVALAAWHLSAENPSGKPLELYVFEPWRSDRRTTWQSGQLLSDRGEALRVLDINRDGREEILSMQSQGAAGQTLYVLARKGQDYGWLRPQGGYFAGRDSFGETGVRVQDLDGDGVFEILADYGPASSKSDVYRWDGQQYVYQHTVELT